MSLFLPCLWEFIILLFFKQFIYLCQERNVDSVAPRRNAIRYANSPPLFYHSTRLRCRQDNQCWLEGLRAKGYVSVPGWSLSSRLCAHLPALRPRNGQAGSGVKLPLFYVLVVVQTRTARTARLGFIFAGFCGVSLHFCISIRTSAPCERLSSVCNDGAND